MAAFPNSLRWALAAVALTGMGMKSAFAGVILIPPAAMVQASSQPGAATGTFDGVAAGAYTTLSSSGLPIMTADQDGEAGGFGSYPEITGGAPIPPTLCGGQSYVGLWWPAADDDSMIVATTLGSTSFRRSDLPASSDDHGNPNPPLGRKAGEPYIDVIFAASLVGEKTASIGFSNRGRNTATTPDGEADDPGVYRVPEPSSLALAVLASAAAATAGIRRNRRSRRLRRRSR